MNAGYERLFGLTMALLVVACGERQVSTTPAASVPRESSPVQPDNSTAPVDGEGSPEPTKASSVQELLEGVRDGTIPPDELSVSFSNRGDPHFGYFSITVSSDIFTGTNSISVESSHGFRSPTKRATDSISPAQHRQLVEELLSIQAWEQLDQERVIRRGENRSILELSGAGQSSTIWELPPEPGETPPAPRITRVSDLLLSWAPEIPSE